MSVQPSHFDDRVGPLGLCAAVITALTAILIVSFVDFMEFISASGDTPAPGPAPPAPAAGPAALVRLVGMATGLEPSSMGHTRQ